MKLAKKKKMLSNNLTLNFCYLKIIYILYPWYHLKKIRHILQNKQKNQMRPYFHDDTIDQGLDMGTNKVNKKVSLLRWWYVSIITMIVCIKQ